MKWLKVGAIAAFLTSAVTVGMAVTPEKAVACQECASPGPHCATGLVTGFTTCFVNDTGCHESGTCIGSP